MIISIRYRVYLNIDTKEKISDCYSTSSLGSFDDDDVSKDNKTQALSKVLLTKLSVLLLL
jgi:hypothetical protein